MHARKYQLMTLGSGVRVFACMSYHGDGSHHGELLSYMAAITMAKGARIVMQVGLQRAPNRHTSQM